MTGRRRGGRYLDRLELEQLACVLAAMVDVDATPSQMAWWRMLRAVS